MSSACGIFGVISGVRPAMRQVLVEYLVCFQVKGLRYVKCLWNIWCDFRCKACDASGACGIFGVLSGERPAMRQVLVEYLV